MDTKEIRRRNMLRCIAENDGNAAELARKSNTDAGYISQIKNGTRPMGEKAARKFERNYGLSPGWMDTLWEDYTDEAANDAVPPAEGVSDDKYAFIPRLTAKAAAGDGHENHHVEIMGTLAFQRQWLAKKGLQPGNLQVFDAAGDSMSPYISDGDVVLIDTSVDKPENDEVWVVYQTDWGLRLKRILFRENGDMIIRSDNPDRAMFPDEIIPGPRIVDEIKIIGKLAWRGG